MSAEVKDLIRRLVRTDVKKRLSAASALNHDWFDVDFTTKT
jgi:serine/threonine protein kinase